MAEPLKLTKPLKLTEVRLSFPALFQPVAYQPGDPLKFKATFLIKKDSTQAKTVEAAILVAAKERWGAKAESMLKAIRGNPNKMCWQDGDNKEYDGYAGMMALSAKSDKRFPIVDRDKTPLTEADGKPYAGCFVDASVTFFAYEQGGISASIRWIQFHRDGEAFGGGIPVSEDEFSDIAEGATADDML